jgi:hypothetical protein
MYTTRNTVLIALMQVGVIVFGVLGAAICRKVGVDQGVGLLLPTVILYNLGMLGFLIPMGWSVLTVVVLRHPRISDGVKGGVFWLGVMILLGLVVFVLLADFGPGVFHGVGFYAAGEREL